MSLTELGIQYASLHLDPSPLPGDERSCVFLSKRPPTALVVFVHGFRGDALETWQPFDRIATGSEAFREVDLVFFGYDAHYSNVMASSSFLYDFLKDAVAGPEAIVSALLPKLRADRSKGYKRIVLVAHSLGAVVCRWALLRAVEEKKEWRENVKMLLFAPAHSGSDLGAVASAAFSNVPWVPLFVEAVKAKVPLVKELDPESRILTELAERVRRASPNELCLRAHRVIVAEREIVVSNLPFPGDPCPDALRDTDHVSVCKPSSRVHKAVGFLQEMLK